MKSSGAYHYKGKFYTAKDLCRKPYAICTNAKVFADRISKGWSVHKALMTITKGNPAKQSGKIRRQGEDSPESIKYRFSESDKARHILIMSVPVNPVKCRYTALRVLYKQQANQPSQFLEIERK